MENTYYNSKFEDTIQCSFFSTRPTHLEDLCKSINGTVKDLSKDFIWHRDEFKISVSVFDEERKDMPVHLTSTTCFGDNIEDEWFIVYLVFEITRQYTDLVVQIEDNDGDFLLIEAAEFLPSWASPDTTKNRVFIYHSKIHIIPPEVIQFNSKLNLQDALTTVVQKFDITKASTEVQEAVLKRINSYPQKIKENHHKALVTLPVDIAALLTIKPTVIAPIVTSFCNHDMWDAKYLRNINLEHCVTVPILFTKYLYAMLVHSKLPRISKFTSSSQNNNDIALGWKLAYGHEIIMSKSSSDIYTSSEYHNFINRLTKNGYFRDNIEGSKDYNELLKKAKDYFSNIESTISSYFCNNISEIKATEEFRNVRHSLLNRENTSQPDIDSEEWLNITPDELNTFLNTHYGKKVFENKASTASQVTKELAHFLEKKSDLEGIEYVKEEEFDTEQIVFDTDQFVSSVEKMLSLVCGEDNDSDFEDSFSEEDDETVAINANLEKELASKLQNYDINSSKDDNVLKNLLQSIKEEGISGPSSNVLKNIDVSNIELLDSDDD